MGFWLTVFGIKEFCDCANSEVDFDLGGAGCTIDELCFD